MKSYCHSWVDFQINLIVVQLLSRVQLLATPCTAAYQTPLSFTVSQILLKFLNLIIKKCYNFTKKYFLLCSGPHIPVLSPLALCFPSDHHGSHPALQLAGVQRFGWCRCHCATRANSILHRYKVGRSSEEHSCK